MNCHKHKDRKAILLLNDIPMCKECSVKAREVKNKKKTHFTVIGIKEGRKIDGGI